MLKILVLTSLFTTAHSIGMELVPEYVEILEKLPYQVRIGFYDEKNTFSHQCGGSIISERWVLTTAQCFNVNIVLAGSHIEYEKGNWSNHRINDTVPHPFFNDDEWSDFDNDIMLIRVIEPFYQSNTVKYVPLYTHNESTSSQATAIIGHWGSRDTVTSQCEYARILDPMNVSVVTTKECYALSENSVILNRGEICIKFSGDYENFCSGDVGAPLIMYSAISQKNALAGILSRPIYTDSEEYMNSMMLYTPVAKYREWITIVSGV